MQDQITCLRVEITKLTALLKNNESELESYQKLCNTLKQSLHEKEILHQNDVAKESSAVTVLSVKNEENTLVHDKIALQVK